MMSTEQIGTFPAALIFMGIQASGKSSFYRERLADCFVHINLDSLHTRNKERLLLEECIRKKISFVVDNTNPTKADRARYIEPAREAGYQIVGLFFQSKLHDCIRRNRLRTGKECIPAKAIIATSNKLELPNFDEGFDKLYFVEFGDDADPETGKTQMIISEWKEQK